MQIQYMKEDPQERGYPVDIKKIKEYYIQSDLIPLTKINSKWIIDLNIKCRAITLLEENTIKNLDDLGYGKDLLDTTLKSQSMK